MDAGAVLAQAALPVGPGEGCAALTALDLSPLAGLTSLGVGFLLGCGALTALDLSPLGPG